MSLHHTRSVLESVARWPCAKVATCIHCEAVKALHEVEAVEEFALDFAEGGVYAITAAGDLVMGRIAEETRRRGET